MLGLLRALAALGAVALVSSPALACARARVAAGAGGPAHGGAPRGLPPLQQQAREASEPCHHRHGQGTARRLAHRARQRREAGPPRAPPRAPRTRVLPRPLQGARRRRAHHGGHPPLLRPRAQVAPATAMLRGAATAAGTTAYRSGFAALGKNGHFREWRGLALSSVGVGTYLGPDDDATD